MRFAIVVTNLIKNDSDHISIVLLEIRKYMCVLIVAIYVIIVNQDHKLYYNLLKLFVMRVKFVMIE